MEMDKSIQFKQYLADNNAYQQSTERQPYIEATRRAQGIVQRTIETTHSNVVRYTVPAHIDGFNRYNRDDCVEYVKRELQRDGCMVTRSSPGSYHLDIQWYDAHHIVAPPVLSLSSNRTTKYNDIPTTNNNNNTIITSRTPRAQLPAPIRKAPLSATTKAIQSPPSRSLTGSIDTVDKSTRQKTAHLHQKLLETMASDWEA